MRAEATILHADLDSFYASVEQRDDPSLRGKPIVVGGGVVLAASYEAKAFGVFTPMGGRQARELCPNLIEVSPRFSAYSEASKAVFEIFNDTTPLVEGISPDEAFLDVGGLRRLSGTPVEIATRLRARVLQEVGLPITVGIARTKFLAKVASGVAKPDGLLVVRPMVSSTSCTRSRSSVSGEWHQDRDELHDRGIDTVADVARSSSRRSCPSSAPTPVATCMHSRTTTTRGPSRSAVDGGRSVRSAIGWRAKAPGEIEATLAGLVDR